MSTQLELGPARDFERDWILDLWEEQFGHYGEHEEDMVDAALNRDHSGVWCYTIGSREDLYAFTIVTKFAVEDFADAYDVDTRDWPKAVDNGNTYMVCVDDRAKNRGYAKKVIRRSYQYFWQNGIRRLWATCWHRDDHVDSRKLFESLGYRQLAVEKNYYQSEDDKPDRDCPDCGRGCTCTASHWTKVLEEDDVDRS